MAACEDPAGFSLLRWAVGEAMTSAALATPGLMLAATPCQGWNLRELLDHLSDSMDAVREAITCGRVGPGQAPGLRPPRGTERQPGAEPQPGRGRQPGVCPQPGAAPLPGLDSQRATFPVPDASPRPVPARTEAGTRLGGGSGPWGGGTPASSGCGTGTGMDQGDDPVSALRAQAVKLLAACAAAPDGDPVVTVGGLGLLRSAIAETGAVEVAVHGWDIRVACGDRRPVPSALADELLPLAVLLVPAGTRHGLFADPVRVPRTAGPGDRLVAFLGRRPPLLWGDGHSAAG
jgi:uncharacterized protein (TIGR03086 family)